MKIKTTLGRSFSTSAGSLSEWKKSFPKPVFNKSAKDADAEIKRYASRIAEYYNLLKQAEVYFARRQDVKKVGRNESCPCGSGKKYKKCCLNKELV